MECPMINNMSRISNWCKWHPAITNASTANAENILIKAY
jgi:hypothetical protein